MRLCICCVSGLQSLDHHSHQDGDVASIWRWPQLTASHPPPSDHDTLMHNTRRRLVVVIIKSDRSGHRPTGVLALEARAVTALDPTVDQLVLTTSAPDSRRTSAVASPGFVAREGARSNEKTSPKYSGNRQNRWLSVPSPNLPFP